MRGEGKGWATKENNQNFIIIGAVYMVNLFQSKDYARTQI